MGQSTAELRRDIEDTRANMSRDLDAIGDRVSPRRMAERKVARTRNWFGSMKDRVMGAGEHMTDAIGGGAGHAKDAVTHVPDVATARTQGSPVAAGAVAFGIGFLASMAFGATEAEQRAVGKLEDEAQPVLEPMKEQLTEAAHEVAGQVRERGTELAGELKDDARERAGTVKEQASAAADQVREQAR